MKTFTTIAALAAHKPTKKGYDVNKSVYALDKGSHTIVDQPGMRLGTKYLYFGQWREVKGKLQVLVTEGVQKPTWCAVSGKWSVSTL